MKRIIWLICILSFSPETSGMIINGKRNYHDFKKEPKEEIIELFCVPDDLIPQIMSNLDYKSNIQFIRTSKNLYEHYKDKDILCHHLNSDDYTNAMIYYSRKNDIKKIQFLMKNEGEVNKKNRKEILGHLKIKDSIQEVIEIYKNEYNEKNISSLKKVSSLNFCYFTDKLPLLSLLIKQGFNSSLVDRTGCSMLNIAISRDYLKTLRFLLAQDKINLNITPEATLFHDAIKYRNYRCLKVLLAHSEINKNFKDKDGKTLLHYCVQENSDEELKLLLPDIDPNMQDNKGQTVLHQACSNKNLDIITILLADKRINQNLRDKNDNTAMDYLVKSIGHLQYVHDRL